MKRIGLVALVVVLTAGASSAFAWGPYGHKLVAAVAWQQLTPQTREKVNTLLKQNPDYAKWIAGVPEDRRDEYAFMAASNWADDIKRDDRYTDDRDFVTGPNAARNIGYEDSLRHRYWHYTDFAFSLDGTRLDPADPVNIQTQIRVLRETLKSATADASLKSYDLVWLIHLVGDAHQPLHATSRFTQALPKGDNGGNGVTVCETICTDETKESLHAFWDDVPGQATNRGHIRKAARSLPKPNAATAAISSERVWLEESFELAKSTAYTAPVTASIGPFTLTDAYKIKAAQISREQISLAGVRLAHLIETCL